MTDEELTDLVDALDRYDEGRVRAAIEVARDPAVGPRLVARLGAMLDDDGPDADRLARAALAVVVVEADAPAAFEIVFEHLMDGGGDFIDDVLEYVLARRGERTVREAIARLSTEDDPGARGILYVLLQAANGGDPALVADAVAACHDRWEFERAQTPADPDDEFGWTPATSLCYALVVLGDPSVRPMIAGELRRPRRKEHRDDWKAAADYADRFLGHNSFDAERTIAAERAAANRARLTAVEGNDYDPAADEYADADLDWRQDWTVQMPRWAKVYDPDEQEKVTAKLRGQMEPLREMLERMAGSYGLDGPADGDPDDEVIREDDFEPPPRADEVTMPIRAEQKVGRNDPCPCGSGKKYKKCHGAAGGP